MANAREQNSYVCGLHSIINSPASSSRRQQHQQQASKKQELVTGASGQEAEDQKTKRIGERRGDCPSTTHVD
jgi:hypothetical protein